MPNQSRNRRQQRRKSLKMKGGEENEIMDKLNEIEGKIDGLNTLIMQSNSSEEVPKEEVPKEEVPKEEDEEHDDKDAAGDLKTVTPKSINDESNEKLATPEIKSEMSGTGSEMSGTGSEMSGTGSGMPGTPENNSENNSEMPGGRRNSRRRRQRNNRKSQRRQRRR